MRILFQQIYRAAKQVFSEKKYIVIFFTLAILFFWLFVLIPVITIPGNTLALQLPIFRPQDYLLIGLLAILVGLNFSMNIYSWQRKKSIGTVCSACCNSIGVGFSGAFAAIVGSASCVSCLSFLFATLGLGFGAVVFVLKYQIYFLLGVITLVAISLYFTARKIANLQEHY